MAPKVGLEARGLIPEIMMTTNPPINQGRNAYPATSGGNRFAGKCADSLKRTLLGSFKCHGGAFGVCVLFRLQTFK